MYFGPVLLLFPLSDYRRVSVMYTEFLHFFYFILAKLFVSFYFFLPSASPLNSAEFCERNLNLTEFRGI